MAGKKQISPELKVASTDGKPVKPEKDRKFVEALSRGLDVLRAFSQGAVLLIHTRNTTIRSTLEALHSMFVRRVPGAHQPSHPCSLDSRLKLSYVRFLVAVKG